MEELVLSLDLAEQEITITKKDGEGKKYVLRELTSKQKSQYLNSMRDKITFTDGKVSGVKDFDGLEACLLTRCLYTEESKLVTTAILQEFPARVVKKLFETAQILSALNEEGVKEAKND
jgi:hypothetical protein